MKNYKKCTNSRRNKSTKKANSIAVIGICVALIIVLQLFAELLQKLGMPMSFALGLIPVLVVAQTHGTKYGLICGGVFGLISLIMAVIGASAIPMYVVAINPLVSVFPRIAVGGVCAGVFCGIHELGMRINKYPTQSKRRVLTLGASATATLCGVLTNTLLFLGMFLAFANGKTYDGLLIDFRWLLASVVALNTLVEAILFTALVPFIVLATSNSRASGYAPIYSLEYKRPSNDAEKTDSLSTKFDDD